MQQTNLFAQTMDDIARQLSAMATQTANSVKNFAVQEKEIEQMEPYYFNPKWNRKLPTIYRFNSQNMRFYFDVKESPNEDGTTEQSVTFYPSVTTIIDKTTPFSEGLKILLADKGYDGFKKFMNERANYGTFLHVQIADYFRSGDSPETRFYDLDAIASKVEIYALENALKFPTDKWAWEIKNDLLSIKKFIDDHKVEPIAIELVGAFNNGIYRYAGAIDLICEMTIEEKGFYGETYKSGKQAGEPKESKQEKRITAIVDFKSGKSGFFESHEIQLHMYKIMAENLGFQIDKVFNVSPKIWEGDTPTYHIKDQTDSVSAAKIVPLLHVFNVTWKEPKDLKIISGKLNGSGISEVCRMVPAKEYVLNRISKN